MLLSPPSSNVKLAKSTGLGYLPYGLSLAPFTLSGINVCPHATAGCRASCVGTAGLAQVYTSIMVARIAKTHLLFRQRDKFMARLAKEVQAAHRKAQAQGLKLALRLNVFSDLDWRSVRHSDGWTIFDVIDELHDVQVYDYTKSINRARRELRGGFRTKWTTVFSRSETNDAQCLEFLREGGSVAIPFVAGMHQLPRWHDGYRVVDGDLHDLLFLQPANRIIGLSAKGALKRNNQEGFAVTSRDNVTFGGW